MITARREFLKNTLIGTAPACTGDPFSVFAGIHPGQTAKAIRIDSVASNFEREPLIRPFGFKGGYMTEMWQTAAKIHSSSGIERIGICTQNVLYADADVFALTRRHGQLQEELAGQMASWEEPSTKLEELRVLQSS